MEVPMYVQPQFRMNRAECLAFAAARGFGLVVAYDGARPVASPLPFHLDYGRDGSPRARFHMARSNSLAALAACGGRWLIAVSGADAYVSPEWYASPDQVPTWLYEEVHLSGAVRALPGPLETVEAQTHQFEAAKHGEAAWQVDRVTPGRLSAMLKAIVAIEMEVELVEGSAKLNQHKSDADHEGVVAGLRGLNDPMAAQIADRMVALRPHLSYDTATEEVCDA
jgi:transcriptional regulator